MTVEVQFAPKNQWYIAAFSRDVTRTLLERWLLDELVVLYRTEDGEPVAIEGRCAHRHFPLVHGTLRGDNVECPYHGFTYAPDGSCTRVPVSPRPPANCRIKSYPVVERWKWIWIWMGDPALADPSLIPDLESHGLGSPDFTATEVFYGEVQCRYELLHDNLLDLSHLSFLHFNTIGGGSDVAAVTLDEHTEGPNWLQSERLMSSVPCPGHFSALLGYEGLIDRHVPIKFYVPSIHVGLDDFTTPAADESAPQRSLGQLLVLHAVTPARRNTCHYHFATARNFARDVGDVVVDALAAVIHEDVFGVEAVERVMAAYGDNIPPEFHARNDNHQLRGRKVLADMIKAEQAGTDRLAAV